MSIYLYLKFCFFASLLSALPGPTILIIIHYTLIYGRESAKYSIPGSICGDVIALTLSFTIIKTFMDNFLETMDNFQTLGGIYLILIGLYYLFSKPEYIIQEKEKEKIGHYKVFLHVFLITAFNPKTIAFMLAFFPQFIEFNKSFYQQILLISATFISIGVLYASIYVALAVKVKKFLRNHTKQLQIQRITGIILLLFGSSVFNYF